MKRPIKPAPAVLGFAASAFCALAGTAFAQTAPAAMPPLIEAYCADCHNSEDWAGGLDFDLLLQDPLHAQGAAWEGALRKLRGRLMPPPGSAQPGQAQLDAFITWLETTLDANPDLPRAGHVPLQRLNRVEYARAVRDLIGVSIDAAEYLPTDMEVDGFDNIAAALSISPAFLEQYIGAARAAARLAVGDPTPKLSNVYYPSPGGAQGTFIDGMPPGSRGGMKFVHHFPADGEYRFNVLDLDVGLYPRAAETRHTLVILVGGEEVFRGDVGGEEDLSLVDREGAVGRAAVMARFADIPAAVKAGAHEVVFTFIERSRAESDQNVGSSAGFGGTRVPRILDGVQVVGPFDPIGVSTTPSREKIFSCYPRQVEEERACVEQIITQLAERAYRRPATREDVDLLLPFFEVGRAGENGFDGGVEQVVAAMLASPDFLFRGISMDKEVDAEVVTLDGLELATRLSFFLWGQGPDAALLARANAGELHQPAVLQAEVHRLLQDARAWHLVENFAFKWLNLDDLDEVDPAPGVSPGYSGELRADFAEEARLFIGSILLEDRPVRELLDASHTFLNERLARHYGIRDVHGAQFRRVTLADETRWGLLGKSAVLLRTSYGDRTSPVLRGAWVLERLQGTPPAPPPPNVETDLSVPLGQKPTTVRARLEAHRDNPNCNQCHGVIDPIGLALENFDVTGRWRAVDLQSGDPIDARTVLPGERPVDGPVALRRELLRDPARFAQALTEKLMMFALGRELEYFDMPQIRTIVREAVNDDWRFSALVLGVVNSDAFRLQALARKEGH